MELLSGGGQFTIVWAMEVILSCSVNIYALISGYVGYTRTELRIPKFIMLWIQVFFYSILFYLLISLRTNMFSIKELIKVCLPITTTQYWYFTAYTGVYFVAPGINWLIGKMEKYEVKKAFWCFGSVFLLYLPLTGILYDPFKIEGGYSFAWLTILYTLGAFMRRLNLVERISGKKAMICLTSCWLIAFMTKILIPSQNIFINYTSITSIGISTMLIIIFSKIKFNSENRMGKFIRTMASATFGVYLIHDNDWIRRTLITDKFKWLAELVPWKIVVLVCGIGFIVFCLSLCIELMRSKIFAALKIETKINMLLNVKTNIEKGMRKVK